ncbi:hypothetical protein AB6A40_006248 [Gnathostoma spinigerum]|uniref:Uncharacterized protein n=1 Tax=Gnathostoma spinigerum TaxID=75299 RepID=A0ABD6EN09_9BILA
MYLRNTSNIRERSYGNTSDRILLLRMANIPKEVLGVENGLVFDEEIFTAVFCKPKLIPLKSITLEKLERMQKESVEKMNEMENKPSDEPTEMKDENVDKKSVQKTDIWTADNEQS